MAMPCVRRTPRTSRRPQYCATKMDAPLMAPNMATWKRKEMRLAWVTPANGTSPRTPIIRLSTSCIEAVDHALKRDGHGERKSWRVKLGSQRKTDGLHVPDSILPPYS